MAFIFNPFTGSLDEVKIPLSDNIGAPAMSVNGDMQTALVGSDGRLYFEANNTRYYISGIPPVANTVNISAGQPIPIGMGMFVTYANNVT
jgi:hypothetical protein